MDLQKLDPVVAAAVSKRAGDQNQDLPVLVHVSAYVNAKDVDRVMRHYGVSQPVRPGGVVSMTLPAREIGKLSDQSWVVAIRAARQR